jgi:XTP/dITP diphosphohydrolase
MNGKPPKSGEECVKSAGTRLVIASFNAGKIAELQNALGFLQRQVVGAGGLLAAPPVEDAGTFRGNARLKAEAVAAVAGNGAWVLADDSGLEVAALGGFPGVETAHFGGWKALLAAMRDVPEEQRQARFVCVLALLREDGEPLYFEGACAGLIAPEARGESGFDFDCVFVPEGGDGRTFAQMTAAEKDGFSHRGQALQALRAWWDGRGADTPDAPVATENRGNV